MGMLSHREVALLKRDWRCGLVGESLTLVVGALRFQKPKPGQMAFFMIPEGWKVDFSNTMSTSCHVDNSLNAWNCKPVTIKCFLSQEPSRSPCLRPSISCLSDTVAGQITNTAHSGEEGCSYKTTCNTQLSELGSIHTPTHRPKTGDLLKVVRHWEEFIFETKQPL